MSRYIDADALEKILAYWIEEKGYARKKHSEEFVEGMEDAYCRVLCFVKMEPKADIPDRKVGKWKLNKAGNWACPFCEFDPYHDNMKGMNFCPNCGAKMEVNNGEIH